MSLLTGEMHLKMFLFLLQFNWHILPLAVENGGWVKGQLERGNQGTAELIYFHTLVFRRSAQF